MSILSVNGDCCNHGRESDVRLWLENGTSGKTAKRLTCWSLHFVRITMILSYSYLHPHPLPAYAPICLFPTRSGCLISLLFSCICNLVVLGKTLHSRRISSWMRFRGGERGGDFDREIVSGSYIPSHNISSHYSPKSIMYLQFPRDLLSPKNRSSPSSMPHNQTMIWPLLTRSHGMVLAKKETQTRTKETFSTAATKKTRGEAYSKWRTSLGTKFLLHRYSGVNLQSYVLFLYLCDKLQYCLSQQRFLCF